MKLLLTIILSCFLMSCVSKKYRIEQYYYLNGKNNRGTMWNDSKKINSSTYSYKAPEGFNPDAGFDSVVFKIVEIK